MSTRLPKGIPFIVANEAAERFSFYGLRSILATFLIAHFYNPTGNQTLQAQAEAQANHDTHLFTSLIYFIPFFGGLLADWFWGKYRTILWLSIVYAIGCFCLAAFTTYRVLFLLGLLLIAIGSGGIKPCVAAHVGDQFVPANKHLMERAFSLFYLSINVGSLLSTLLIPWVYRNHGPALAFGIPGLFMAIATLIFFLGRNRYLRLPPTGTGKSNFLSVSFHALFHGWQHAREHYGASIVQHVRKAWRFLGFLAFMPLFWAMLGQSYSEWVLQATKLDLEFLGVRWLPEQIQSLNPMLILILIPLLSFGIMPALQKRGVVLSPQRRVGWGFVLVIAAFLVIWSLQRALDSGAQPSIGWQMLAYALLTFGEVLVYNAGMEYAYAQAPTSMKSTIMSCFILTAALGNYLVAAINGNMASGGFFARFTGADYFLLFIVLMAASTVLFLWRYARPAAPAAPRT